MPNLGAIEAMLSKFGGASDDALDAARAALYLAALDHPGIGLARYEVFLRDLASGA